MIHLLKKYPLTKHLTHYTLKHRRNKSLRKHTNESIQIVIIRGRGAHAPQRQTRAGMRVTNAIRWSFEPDVSHFPLASTYLYQNALIWIFISIDFKLYRIVLWYTSPWALIMLS